MYISADYIFDGEHMLQDHVISRAPDGRITAVLNNTEVGEVAVQHYRGYLFPGWVNTHCHLELSHMHRALPTGTGLVDFIKGIVQQRESPLADIKAACAAADRAMYEAGIDAVGDIANTDHSFDVKATSQLRYHTFLEVFDLMQPDQAMSHIEGALDLKSVAPQRSSIVPHAPYSCSPALLKMIREHCDDGLISIHNQETLAEHAFFMKKEGALIDFYETLGLDLSAFEATGEASLAYYLDHAIHRGRHLYVHNTEATIPEVARAMDHTDAYWVTCPQANLYIESSLPDYSSLIAQGARICIGTDSLASNWHLDIWEEMRTIKRYHSYLTVDDILRWGSAHGADALNMSDDLGRIKAGTRPSLLHLDSQAAPEDLLHNEARPVRLVLT